MVAKRRGQDRDANLMVVGYGDQETNYPLKDAGPPGRQEVEHTADALQLQLLWLQR